MSASRAGDVSPSQKISRQTHFISRQLFPAPFSCLRFPRQSDLNKETDLRVVEAEHSTHQRRADRYLYLKKLRISLRIEICIVNI